MILPSNVYKIGDRGPAGGVIFFDMGFIYDGWRYLEAAPPGTVINLQWGADGSSVDGTSDAIGTGKRNTELIVECLIQLGESMRASQFCASMNLDGFTDWFLPSRDELDLMYRNLHQKGMGGFDESQYYWSSTQYDRTQASVQEFRNGYIQQNAYKSGAHKVRAIRSF